MDIREVGDGFVALDGDRALSIEGDAAAAYRAGGMSRRQMLTRIGAGVAVAGVSYVALPMAAAHASLITGNLVVALSPTTGGSGRIVLVTVTNLPTVAGTAITTVFVGATQVTPSNTTVTGGTASFNITIPDNEPLTGLSVVVNDNHNNTGQATYTVAAPTVTLGRTAFAKKENASVTISGSGFASNSTVTVTPGSGWGASPLTFATSSTGTFSSNITINAPNGNSTQPFVFTDNSGNTRSVSVSAS